MISRKFRITVLMMLLALPVVGQVVTRSEFIPYALRKDADSRIHSDASTHIKFKPTAVSAEYDAVTREQVIDVPQSWQDEVVMIHIENPGEGYSLRVNGQLVAVCEDTHTPSDYDISRFLNTGKALISITSRKSALPQLEQGVVTSQSARFENSYIYTQNRLRIKDYFLEMTEHTDGKHGQLFINVIVENRFNYTETIEVGFDVYDPTKKLLDFSTAKATLEGNSVDTIRFAPHLYGAAKFRWDPSSPTTMRVVGRASRRYSDQMLYSVMIFTKRNNVSSSYIPFSVGFSLPEYRDGELYAWGRKIPLNSIKYTPTGNKAQTEKELREIRNKGINTIEPSYPQPLWFYSLCDKIGLYVIEQAAINAPENADNRGVGGTPSNDPKLAEEYLTRVKKMYYRTRNFTCVVAYSLGGDSGNGYNMYKAYQWLKSVETQRPIIYPAAGGEWNNDSLTIYR